MVAVGSVNFEENVKPGAAVEKGDMLVYFAFGGSDFTMIFQDEVVFALDTLKLENGDSYKAQTDGRATRIPYQEIGSPVAWLPRLSI